MDYDVIIIGAGATGLIAANTAHERGQRVLLLEQGATPGGRLLTERGEDGFILDRGFQILLTAYPAVKKWLDVGRLGVKAFEPGANVLLPDGSSTIVGDPLRSPKRLFSTLKSPVGSFADKARLLALVAFVRSHTSAQLFETADISTLQLLVHRGFSATMIDIFFRPFYGGIFLERELKTSARFFLFAFKMFAEGDAVLPRLGIQAIGEQLAARLPTEAVKFGSEVTTVTPKSVTTAAGTTYSATRVIDTRPDAAEHIAVAAPRWLSTINIYFSCPTTSLPLRLITLVPGGGPVNNIAVLTGVQPGFAPAGHHLISVTLYTQSGKTLSEYADLTRLALRPWLEDEVVAWHPLRHFEIARALPFSPHVEWLPQVERWTGSDGVIRTGDWRLHPSLQAAMDAGEATATM